MMDTEDHFERYLEGRWRRRWWSIGPATLALIDVRHYTSGKITGDIIAVSGIADDGTSFEFEVRPNATRIPGYRRV